MRLNLMFAIASTLLASGCATPQKQAEGPDPKLQAELAGKVAGTPRACISIDDARGGEYFRDAVVYRQGRTRLWLAETRGCPDNRNADNYITVQRVYGSQVCRGDLIEFVDRVGGFYAGTCSYGNFTEYRLPRN